LIKIIFWVIIQFYIFHTKLALKPCKFVLEKQLNPCFQKFQCFNLGFLSGFKIGFVMKKNGFNLVFSATRIGFSAFKKNWQHWCSES
jgi:hypothetical protein